MLWGMSRSLVHPGKESPHTLLQVTSWLVVNKERQVTASRWHKINDLVGKFCGAYEAGTREKSSSQNETDVLKHAHEIFFNNYKKKFTLENVWKELWNDQNWFDLATSKNERSSKRRKCDEGTQSSTSQATEINTSEAAQATTCPPG